MTVDERIQLQLIQRELPSSSAAVWSFLASFSFCFGYKIQTWTALFPVAAVSNIRKETPKAWLYPTCTANTISLQTSRLKLWHHLLPSDVHSIGNGLQGLISEFINNTQASSG